MCVGNLECLLNNATFFEWNSLQVLMMIHRSITTRLTTIKIVNHKKKCQLKIVIPFLCFFVTSHAKFFFLVVQMQIGVCLTWLDLAFGFLFAKGRQHFSLNTYQKEHCLQDLGNELMIINAIAFNLKREHRAPNSHQVMPIDLVGSVKSDVALELPSFFLTQRKRCIANAKKSFQTDYWYWKQCNAGKLLWKSCIIGPVYAGQWYVLQPVQYPPHAPIFLHVYTHSLQILTRGLRDILTVSMSLTAAISHHQSSTCSSKSWHSIK